MVIKRHESDPYTTGRSRHMSSPRLLSPRKGGARTAGLARITKRVAPIFAPQWTTTKSGWSKPERSGAGLLSQGGRPDFSRCRCTIRHWGGGVVWGQSTVFSRIRCRGSIHGRCKTLSSTGAQSSFIRAPKILIPKFLE